MRLVFDAGSKGGKLTWDTPGELDKTCREHGQRPTDAARNYQTLFGPTGVLVTKLFYGLAQLGGEEALRSLNELEAAIKRVATEAVSRNKE